MPNKKKNNNYYNGYNNQNQNNNRGSGGGGGVQKQGYKNHRKGDRKLYINPNIITSISDDETSTRSHHSDHNKHNGHNGYNNRGSSERKSNNRNRNKNNITDKFKDLGRTKYGIGDDDREIAKALLASKPHCQIANMPKDVFDMIVTYVQNYFTCFDTNREGLLGAYNKMCTFSLSLNMSNTVAYRQFKFEDHALKENRNLKRIVSKDDRNDEKRFRLLHKGYIDTLAQLCKLPHTEHQPNSFKLDIDYFSPTMIKYSLSGVFKEGKPTDKVRPLRSFYRTFVCIPDPASQMTIVNEQFIISHLTNEQHKTYYYVPPEQRVETNTMNTTSPTNGTSNDNSAPVTTLAPVIPAPIPQTHQFPDLNEQQRLMLQQFSVQSKLNLEWSKYCLEHVSWNYDEAAKAFVQFKDNIPKDAYIA